VVKNKPYQYSQKERTADYGFTFNTDQGKRVLKDLYDQCHMAHPTYIKGDSHETAYREGERNVFLRILFILKLKPADMDKFTEEKDYE
jgi:hypothetical protein|tara:strand:+ start:1238 stop:1501 length:264 start_codon:yes stop_codon:yes gene_type:complete